MTNSTDPMTRRQHLETHATPDRHLEFVATLSGRLQADCADDAITLHVRYVADRLILNSKDFQDYLRHLETLHWNSPEEISAAVLGDCNDVLVARWIEVVIDVGRSINRNATCHSIKVEDRQPGWDNPSLLSRLPQL